MLGGGELTQLDSESEPLIERIEVNQRWQCEVDVH